MTGRGGCQPWCTEWTCDEPDCNTCGYNRGCKRVVKAGAVRICASFCNEYTCAQDACRQCTMADAGCAGREEKPPSPPPHPSWPPLPKLSFGDWHASEYYTYGSNIMTNAWGEDGQPSRVRIKGVAWFGLESAACHIGGSDRRSLASTAAWIKAHGFNAVRIPFAADAVGASGRHQCMANGNLGGIKEHNPLLLTMSYKRQIQEIVRILGDAGLLVLLDAHVVHAGVWPDGGKVDKDGRELLTAAWTTLAEDLCDPERYWNVLGADLKNEPYAMYWGKPPAALVGQAWGYSEEDRWDALASELGTLIYGKCPRWLSFVQGVGHCMSDEPGPCKLPSAPGIQDIDISTWWGENLQAAEHSPVDVGERRKGIGKVIGSPHTYGPSTYAQPQFNTTAWPDYPENLPKLWSAQWAHLAAEGVMPIVVGEFGGRCIGKDATFQKRLVQFLSSQRIGAFYWSLNPESGDTGGLIKDWASADPEVAKLAVLEDLPGSRVPTTMERLHASSLFDVKELKPPPPSPIQSPSSPSPPPPPPSPPETPPDKSFDWLLDEAIAVETMPPSPPPPPPQPHQSFGSVKPGHEMRSVGSSVGGPHAASVVIGGVGSLLLVLVLVYGKRALGFVVSRARRGAMRMRRERVPTADADDDFRMDSRFSVGDDDEDDDLFEHHEVEDEFEADPEVTTRM